MELSFGTSIVGHERNASSVTTLILEYTETNGGQNKQI